MKFADHLNKEQIRKVNQLRHSQKIKTERYPKHTKPKHDEKLSFKQWEDIMGKNRDTYKRVGGALKNR